jgi:PAS domain S-box-containing protein
MRHPLRVLSIEDEPKDADLIQNLLETAGILCDITRVENQAGFLASLKQGGIDLILADYSLPSFDGISALKLALKACPDIPFIFVSGTLGEEVAIEALKLGATDYVLKTSLSKLVPSVERALREATQKAERKRTEEALRKGEAYLAEAQRLSHTGSFGWKPSTGEIFWSEESFRIFQYDRSTKPTVELVLQRVHPEDAPSFKVTVEQASLGGKDFEHEYRLVMPDGAIKHVHVVARADRDESGEIEFVGAVMDATERKRAEEELRRSEEFLLEAQKLSHTGSWRHAVASGAITVSPQIYRIHDIQSDDSPSNTEFFFTRFHPEDRKRVVDLFERAEIEKTQFEVDYRIVLPDGTIKYLHTTGRPILNDSGDLVEFVGTAMDVTAAKEAEQTLRRSEGYLADAQSLSHTGSWAWIPAIGEITYLSEECCRIMGLDPHNGQPRFREIFERIHPDDQAKVSEVLETAERQKTEFELDNRIVHPSGEIRDMHVVGHPVLNTSGDLVEFVGTMIDITERKRTEESLRRSEGYLAEAQRLSHTGSWAWNAVSRHSVYWSLENYRLFGFDPEAGIPSDEVFYQRVHPEDRDRVRKEVYLERPDEGSHFDVDFRIVLPGGAIKYVRSTGHPVRNLSGDLEYIGTSIDITERKRAEERTRLIIDTVPAQLWTESPDGVVDFVNRRWIDYTGMTLEQAIGSGWNRMVHPDDIERVLSKWRVLVAERKPREIESRLRRCDGTYRWFLSRCYPLVDGSGQILGWYGSDTDIHDRKEAEEKLRQSEAHLQEAQTLGRMGSWVFDISAGTVSGSPELFRIFGRDPGEERRSKEMLRDVRSMPIFHKSIHPEDLPFVEEFTGKLASELRPGEIEYRIVLPDGSVKHVHSVAHPVLDDSGNVVEFIGTIMDVTERKRADESLRQAQVELAHVNRVATMGELTASLAHEVNQPIAASVTNAKTCLRWLAGDAPNLEEARAAVMRIVKDQTRAAEIISRTRLLFTKGTPQWEWVDVNEVVQEMIVLLRGEATRYNISVLTDLVAGLPEVKGDRVQLQQVLMNLIMNSIDAMKDVEGTRELGIKSQRAEKEEILVSVSDTGVGLPGQQAEQIFTAFFTTKSHGTGMGLRISRSIVESHGGRLWAIGNSPRGASFYFTLPIKVEPAE